MGLSSQLTTAPMRLRTRVMCIYVRSFDPLNSPSAALVLSLERRNVANSLCQVAVHSPTEGTQHPILSAGVLQLQTFLTGFDKLVQK